MHVLDANEIFGMTFYTYDRILEEGGTYGPDALALYIKLIKQTRIQQTNQTYSLDSFLENGLGRGYKRLKNAKEVLKNLGLMDNIVIRDTQGKVVGHYVRVNFLINEQKVRTQGITYNLSTTAPEPVVADSQMWLNEHKCLKNININALNTKQENTKEISKENTNSFPKQDITDDAHHSGTDLTKYNFNDFWREYPHARKGKKKESEKYFNQQDAELVRKQVAILNFKISSGIQDAQFIPACERRIRDFTPISDAVLKQELLKIAKRHLNAGGDIKARATQLKETFGENAINEAVKTIQQKDSPKNLFLNK